MASGRFLFVTWDGGGNTAPTYPLVRGLVARGHNVAILGQPAQAEAARALGAAFAPLGLPDWTPGKSIEEDRDLFLPLFFGPAVGEAVLEFIARNTPDVLVVDGYLTAGLAAAERSQLPAAALVQTLSQAFVRRIVGQWWQEALPTINTVRARCGLPPAACAPRHGSAVDTIRGSMTREACDHETGPHPARASVRPPWSCRGGAGGVGGAAHAAT